MSIVKEFAIGLSEGFAAVVIVYCLFRTAAAGWSAGYKNKSIDIKLDLNNDGEIFVIPASKKREG